MALIDQLRAAFQPQLQNAGQGSTSWGPPPSQVTIGGRNYIQDGQGGYWSWTDVPAWDTGSSVANYNGQPYTRLDGWGNVIGAGTLANITNDNFMSAWAPFAFVAAGFGAAIFAGAAVGSAGSAALGTGGGGSGAFLGEGVASGVPAWDAAATSAGLDITGSGFITETAADITSASGTASSTAGATGASITAGAAPLASMAGTIAKVGAVLGPLLGLAPAGGTPPGGTPYAYAPPPGGASLSRFAPLLIVGAIVFALAKK